VHYRGAGRRFLRVVYMPEKNDDGKVESWLGSIIDISEQKRRAEAEKMLVCELQHRSNNLLSVIQAIAQKSLSGDRSLDDARTAFEARLLALERSNHRGEACAAEIDTRGGSRMGTVSVCRRLGHRFIADFARWS
jgi:HWE histidine kinase